MHHNTSLFAGLLGLVVVVVVMGVTLPEGSQALDATEIKVLTSLYKRYRVQEWWMPPDCNWPYITCSFDNHLYSLDFYGAYYYFKGELPPELSQLSYVQFINLDNTDFYGPIPKEWGTGFESLRRLEISSFPTSRGSMNISGPFPTWLLGLPNITSIDLSGCNFTGPLPKSTDKGIKWNSVLSMVLLDHNYFSGGLPDTFCHGPASFTTFDVAANDLAGCIPDCYMTKFGSGLGYHGNTPPNGQPPLDYCL